MTRKSRPRPRLPTQAQRSKGFSDKMQFIGTLPGRGCRNLSMTIARAGGTKMTRKALGFVLGVALMAPSFALAQKAAPAGGGDTVSYKQKTVYDFDDDVVEGDLVRPDGEFVDSRRA